MIKIIRSKLQKFYYAALALGLFFPAAAFAQTDLRRGMMDIRGVFGYGGQLANSQDLTDLIANIIRILLLVSGALAVLFVVISGYQYITAHGNEEQAERGKKTLINALIGIVIIILAWVVVNVVIGTVGSSI